MMKNKYPMKLIPVPKEIIWGGNNLKNKYGKTAPFDSIAESWELSVRDNEKSVIENGEYSGISLSDYLATNDFPLLIKFIDAADSLSVQVHPDDGVTDKNGASLGKTEMWYIVDAVPGAQIVYGLRKDVDFNDFLNNAQNTEIEKYLNYVEVHKGDVFFIPSGQIHAIGAGILIAEIQQNSDTTYRLYDYGRLDKNGIPRELHIEKALSAIKIRNDEEITRMRYSGGKSRNTAVSCDKFTCNIYRNEKSLIHTDEGFVSLICVDGGGDIIFDSFRFPMKAGDTYFCPQGMGDFEICGDMTVITAVSGKAL